MPTKALAQPITGPRPRGLDLGKIDPSDTAGHDKESAARRIEKLGQEFAELQDLLANAGQHALLVVLQGRDAAGKDGAARRILAHSNIQTACVVAFKVPTEEERAHDFLWRVHVKTPRRGHFAIFNRSHYEDVIAARVHKLVDGGDGLWRRRFELINAFERSLADANTIIVKFFLHIDRAEQKERLIDREKDPRKSWKLNPGDWEERKLWKEVTKAYEDAIDHCSTPEAPWHIVPSNKKWFRDLVVLDAIVRALRPHKKEWLRHLTAIGAENMAAVRKARQRNP